MSWIGAIDKKLAVIVMDATDYSRRHAVFVVIRNADCWDEMTYTRSLSGTRTPYTAYDFLLAFHWNHMHFLKILVGLVIFKLQLRGENKTIFWIQ